MKIEEYEKVEKVGIYIDKMTKFSREFYKELEEDRPDRERINEFISLLSGIRSDLKLIRKNVDNKQNYKELKQILKRAIKHWKFEIVKMNLSEFWREIKSIFKIKKKRGK